MQSIITNDLKSLQDILEVEKFDPTEYGNGRKAHKLHNSWLCPCKDVNSSRYVGWLFSFFLYR